MSFAFFTLGVMQFWSDVFFYQKWRIQCNFFTKKCRLLDNWDVCRHRGSFEDCKKAFLHYAEVYQMPKQKGHLVVLLHGLGGTKNSFRKMCKQLEELNYPTAAINYPSTRAKLKIHASQVDILLDNLNDISEISFITNGAGGLVVRETLSSDAKWMKKIKVKRIVQINPPNRWNRLGDKLGKFVIFRWIFGPMLAQYDAEALAKLPKFPKNVEFGILCTHNSFFDRIMDFMPKALQNLVPKKEDAFLAGAKDAVNIKVFSPCPCTDKKTINASITFLKKGNFGI